MLRVSHALSIDEKDIDIVFVRASGPGGQNVNKLATAAQLRLDTNRITLPDDARARLTRLAGQRMTKDGVIVIHAQRYRTQERNRADALDRLTELLRELAGASDAAAGDQADLRLQAAPPRRQEAPRRRQGRPRLARLRRLTSPVANTAQHLAVHRNPPAGTQKSGAWLLLFCRETARYYLRWFAAT